jgi:hypothetical protein
VPGPLADVLTALAAAVEAIQRRLPALSAPTWALINAITRGGLLAGPSTA